MAEQLYRKCPECGTSGLSNNYEYETGIYQPCSDCGGDGFISVDAPEPLTGEEVAAIIDAAYSDLVTNVIAALPERFGVRIAALSQEDHDGR